MRVLAISGSLRAASHNTALLRAASRLAPEGVEVELYDGLELLPPYNEDHDTDEPPEEVARLRGAIARADAVLFATPEYNGSVPGQLKNAVDWASRPHRQAALWGKPVGVVGASKSEYGALWAQDHLRKALGIAGARVADVELALGKAHERITPDGELTDIQAREQLSAVVAELSTAARPLARAA
jgi:chromate reductase